MIRLALILLLASAGQARELKVRLTKADGAIRRMPLEEYVAGVLAGEASSIRQAEALKAIANAIRTFAVAGSRRHAAEGYELCDTTHCQNLVPAEAARYRRWAESTRGEMLWYNGSPAQAYHHADCAGQTEAGQNLWPGLNAPYLRQAQDLFCIRAGRSPWQSTVTREELAGVFGAPGDALQVLSRTATGRAAALRIGNRSISYDAFASAAGRALGWNRVRSAWFQVTLRNGEFLLQGYGSGHGVGLCQTGAEQRALAGQTYRQILAFYYPGTAIGVGAQAIPWQRTQSETSEIWSTDLGADAFAVAAVDRQAKRAQELTHFRLQARPVVRLYPTLDMYRDATGQAGWVAAFTQDNTVHVQPPRALGSRRTLDTVLLHEFLHILIGSNAHPRTPEWFHEGLARHFGGDPDDRPHDPYPSARARVRTLIAEHGVETVLRWLKQGLPSSAAPGPGSPARR